MKVRSLLAASAILGSTVLAGVTPAEAAAPSVPVIAMIDTGINPFHQEFDYRGPAAGDDQIVAWWDFGTDTRHLPGPGQLWDDIRTTPFDANGHGSSTASMAAGLNKADEKTPSFHPGARLAIAKVSSGPNGDEVNGDLAAAITWAVDSVHADIVNMSIGSQVPLPASQASDVYEAVKHAREQGVLVVVSNGNGLLGAGLIPDPGWATPFGNSPYVLSVGAAGPQGALVTSDPELVAQFSVNGATKTGSAPDSYQDIAGTSFSSPLVAGFASRLLSEARSAGKALPVERLETLIKHSARDTALPPTYEGYGVIDAGQLAVAITHARAGTLPESADMVNALYVDTLINTMRGIWTTL